MNIFVAKLNYSVSDADLRKAFEKYGDVSSAKIITDKHTGRSKGFGFVEMPNDSEAQTAIKALDQSELKGRAIVVKKATAKSDNRNFNRY